MLYCFAVISVFEIIDAHKIQSRKRRLRCRFKILAQIFKSLAILPQTAQRLSGHTLHLGLLRCLTGLEDLTCQRERLSPCSLPVFYLGEIVRRTAAGLYSLIG